MTKPRKQKDAVLQFLQKRPFIVKEALYPPANKTTAMYSTTLMLQASSFNFPWLAPYTQISNSSVMGTYMCS